MSDLNDELFRLFHRYNKLVRRDLVQPLTCKTCDAILITALKDDQLVLKCQPCASVTTPGVKTIDTVRAVVREHFIDD